jgi:hypothetical protein
LVPVVQIVCSTEFSKYSNLDYNILLKSQLFFLSVIPGVCRFCILDT